MGWWFGRKSAPADARPFVPAWLRTDAAEEGFARWVDAPLGESSEQYRVDISGSAGSLELIVGQPTVTVAAADLAKIGIGPAMIELRQVGNLGASHPAQTNISIS
jgi:hypothetical protein